jgi:hypothetical protein
MKSRRDSPVLTTAPAGVGAESTSPGNQAPQSYFNPAETRETDTYSVFARFRKTRLPLARRVSLQSALSFAQTVRKERFRNPEDVFVVHDRSGETVPTEATPVDPAAAIDAARDTATASDIATARGTLRGDAETSRDVPTSATTEPVRADARADDLLDRAERCRAVARRNVDELHRSVRALKGLLGDASSTVAAAAVLYLKARTPRKD